MSIKQEFTKGVFWIALAKYTGIFISLGITAILARHISPAAFGTMAVATVIMAFLDIFTDLGIGAAIIQFNALTKREINSLFMVGCIVGAILAIMLFSLSIPISRYYNDNQLIPVCHWLASVLLFNSFNIVPNGLMLKNKRFKVVSLRTLSFQIISGSIAVWGALNGWGIYALLVTPVTTAIGVFSVNFYNYPQKFIIDIDFVAVRQVWKYSSFHFLFNVTNYFARNIDKLIIGKYFSMTDLGYYDKSYRLMQLPLQNITLVITPVLHPILSSLQNDKTMLAQKNTKLATLLSQISFPLGIVLYFCAGDIIEIIFGPSWKPSIPIFRILSLSVPLQVILSTSGSIFLAAGKSNHLFYVGVINTIVTVTGFVIAAIFFKTIESMAWAWDITLFLNFFTTYLFMYKATFQENIRRYFYSYVYQIINSGIVIMGMIIYCCNYSIDFPFLALIVKTLLVLLGTLVMAFLLHQYNVFSLLNDLIYKFKCHRCRK